MNHVKAQYFRFLGILIGVSIRTSKPIAINLAPIVWKLLGCAKLFIEDLQDVDYLYAKSLLNLKDIDINGIVTENQFKELIPSETFMGTSFTGKRVPLMPINHFETLVAGLPHISIEALRSLAKYRNAEA